jgi:hypothetical protein
VASFEEKLIEAEQKLERLRSQLKAQGIEPEP